MTSTYTAHFGKTGSQYLVVRDESGSWHLAHRAERRLLGPSAPLTIVRDLDAVESGAADAWAGAADFQAEEMPEILSRLLR